MRSHMSIRPSYSYPIAAIRICVRGPLCVSNSFIYGPIHPSIRPSVLFLYEGYRRSQLIDLARTDHPERAAGVLAHRRLGARPVRRFPPLPAATTAAVPYPGLCWVICQV